MAQPAKLAADIMALLRREAELHGRSVAGQVTRWLKIGRAIELSGPVDHANITAILEGRPGSALRHEGGETQWLDAFTEKMKESTEAAETFFVGRRTFGRGFGLDAGGDLIYAKNDVSCARVS